MAHIAIRYFWLGTWLPVGLLDDRRATAMSAREYLENSRNLAERILRLAVAAVLWWSGQTKAEGFSTREETFYLFREEYKVPLLPFPMPPPT